MRKQYTGFIGVYTFSYFCIGALFPLLGQYLKSIGFDGVQIGTVTAAATAVGIVASPFWGMIYERKACSRRLLYLLYVTAIVLVTSLVFVRAYGLFLAVYIAAFFFESPIRPLNDALTLDSGHIFGKVRLWGSVGFGLGVFIAGSVAERAGLSSIFPMYGLSMLAGLLFLASMRPTAAAGRRERPDISGNSLTEPPARMTSGGFRLLLSNRKYLALILCAFFMNGTMIANNTYFGFLFIESGGTIAGIGLAFLLMVFSEIPVMWQAETIARRIPEGKLLLFVMLLSAARFLWYGTTPPTALLLATFFVQGITNGIFLIIVVKYIEDLVPKQVLGSAITLYTAVSSNAGSIVCLFVGGLLVDRFSGAAVFLFYGAFNLVGVLLYILSGLYKGRLSEHR